MAQTVDQALKQAQLVVDELTYVYVRLPARAVMVAASIVAELAEPFCALVVDEAEVTLIMPEEGLGEFASRLRDHEVGSTRYKVITFDVALEPTLVGFMARVSGALATANVPVFPFAAFSRDHVLVPADQLDAALAALRQLGAH